MKLKPCPFCKGNAHFEREGTARQSCIVECDSCGARLESSEVGERCGTLWNTRTSEEHQEFEIPEITPQLDEFFKRRITSLATKHPSLLVRQLASYALTLMENSK